MTDSEIIEYCNRNSAKLKKFVKSYESAQGVDAWSSARGKLVAFCENVLNTLNKENPDSTEATKQCFELMKECMEQWKKCLPKY